MIVAFIRRMRSSFNDRPLGPIKLGKSSVARHIRLDFGQIDTVDQRERLVIDLCAADNECLIVVACGGNGVAYVVCNDGTGGLKVGLTRYHNRSATREQPAD
jgi:hypothetical protein